MPRLLTRLRLAATLLLISSACVVPSVAEDETPSAPSSSITIRGLRTVSESEARSYIEHQLDYIEENGVSTARADDAAYFLETSLRDRGYEDARVKWQIPTANQILLDVSEGGVLLLVDVICEGNQALSDEGLFELMTSDTRERLDLKLIDEIPYVDDDVEAGRNHVKDYYDLLGYIGSKVTLLKPVIDPDPPGNRASAKLEIIEGKIYHVGEVDLGTPPDPVMATEYETVRVDYAGQIFSPSIASQLKSRLLSIARNAGYYDAEITVTALDPVDAGEFKQVDLTTSANYGRKYRVREIQLTGNEKVKNRYFTRMFDEVTDQPYNPDAAGDVVSDMLKSGAFRRVTAIPEVVDPGAALLDLKVEIEEADSQELGIFSGYGSYEGAILGFEYRHLNLFGLVRRFDSRIEASQRGLTGHVNYTDPWFMWSDWQASLGLFGRYRLNEGYTKLENGLRAELRREFHRKDSITLFAQGSYVDITDFDIDAALLGDENYIDNFAGLSYEVDHRDDVAVPRRGYFFQASNALGSSALGGDYDYLRSTLKFSYHYPIGPTTIHLGARSGAIVSLGGDDDELLPVDLRFFSGGPRSVRSFPERELGPSDSNGYPVGGEFYSTFNAEYEIPIVGPLSLAVFADAGNLLFEFEDASLDEMHYAGGLGLRFNSPLGPLRLDYGHNLNRGADEPSGAFHIGFGLAF